MRFTALGLLLTLLLATTGNAASAKPYMERGFAYYRAKPPQFRAARDQFLKAVAVEPNNDEAWLWLGITHAAVREYRNALAAFRKVLALNPTGPRADLARKWIATVERAIASPPPPPIRAAAPAPPRHAYLADISPVAGGNLLSGSHNVNLFGRRYDKALLMGVPYGAGSVSLVYNINGQFKRFQGLVGMADNRDERWRAIVKVLGDGRVLFESQELRSGQFPAQIDISVQGVVRLELAALEAGLGADIVWADPKLNRN